MSQKKILFIITQSEWGGAQKYIIDIATHLPKKLFRSVIAAGESNSRELFNTATAHEIDAYTIRSLKRSINPILDIKAMLEIMALCKKIKPDIIHLNSSKVSIVGSIAARIAHVKKIIYTVHGWVFNEPNTFWKNIIYLFAERLTAVLKTDIICVSEYDRQVALRYGIASEKKLKTIHNDINLKSLQFYDKKTARNLLSEKLNLEIADTKKIVCSIGNLYKTKGYDYLVKSAKSFPDTLFIIIGEGPQRNHLERLIKQEQVTNVILTGTIKNAYQLLKGADLFILSSLKEGFPYIILEALAANIPIIATNVGGIPEIIPPDQLIIPASTSEIIKAMKDNKKKKLVPHQLSHFTEMIAKTKMVYLNN